MLATELMTALTVTSTSKAFDVGRGTGGGGKAGSHIHVWIFLHSEHELFGELLLGILLAVLQHLSHLRHLRHLHLDLHLDVRILHAEVFGIGSKSLSHFCYGQLAG